MTADETNLSLRLVVMLIAGGGLAFAAVWFKKKTKK